MLLPVVSKNIVLPITVELSFSSGPWTFVWGSWPVPVPVMMMLRFVVNMEEKEGRMFP